MSAELSSLVHEATADPQHQAPGLVFCAIDRHGQILSATAAGLRRLDEDEPMTIDTTFWIASCTKMITAIALMQLVEQAKADLDSADQLERVLPELRDVKILEGFDEGGRQVLKEKKNRITLRMLSTHTAGFGYTLFSENLWRRIDRDAALDEMSGKLSGFMQPIEFEPGTSRAYGIGIDWVGIFVERITGLSLGEYFHRHIFEPLGIQNTAFVPSVGMRRKMASMHARDDEGVVRPTSSPVKSVTEPDESVFQSGGHGLLSNALDYCQILATLLNDGVSPTTQRRILHTETIDSMFTNQIPDWNERYATAGYPVSRPDLANIALRKGLPVTDHQGWGLNFLLLGKDMQRATAPGLSNCFWGLDRKRGVGGILLAQILPFGDPTVYPLWEKLQEVMYREAQGDPKAKVSG